MKKVVLFLLFIPLIANAQLFRGGVVGGINFNQIEGDDVAGYRHIGFGAGPLIDVEIKPDWSVSLEILYTQRGSSTGSGTTLDGRQFKNTFTYVEIPVVLHYHDLGGMSFGAGLSYSRFISATHWEFQLEDPSYFEAIAPNFIPPPKSYDFSLIGDVSYRVTPFFWLNFRINYSVPTVYDRFSFNRGAPVGWRHNSVSLRTIFLFTALKDKKKL